MANRLIQKLQENIADPDHLVDSKVILAPRTPKRYREPAHDARAASVLICLYQKRGSKDYYFSLIKRPSVRGDKHSGQISLPGGRYEEDDISFQACALRETEEEIGVPRDKVQVIGQLSDLYVFASNFIVYPYVGLLDEYVTFIPDQREVERIIEVPVSYLIDAKTIKYTDLHLREGTLRNVPYYDIDNEIVWGATAMILSEFVYYWKVSV